MAPKLNGPRTDDMSSDVSALSYDDVVCAAAFWLSLSLLVLVPLAFSTALYRIFALPKFLILVTGSVALVPLIGLIGYRVARLDRRQPGTPGSKHIQIASCYLLTMTGSTILGVAPVASMFGSFENKMGLITRLCFFACFLGLIYGIGNSRARLMRVLWAMALTGLIAAAYAFIQFFGRDPFLASSTYTFPSTSGSVLRVTGTLGHADYLGNFLLYTTPLSIGLAIGANGLKRRFALIAAGLSTAAIAFSGTRGAWLGLVAGTFVFFGLQLSSESGKLRSMRGRGVILRVAMALFVVAASLWAIASNPASRNVTSRARSFVTEGFTGSGRTLLWRDSLRIVTAFPIVGCGPEGFRKAFLAFKSKELARFAPDINNESSHNSYLDAAVSFGLPGGILYCAIVSSTLLLLIVARRRALDRSLKIAIAGVLSSFVGVAVHNLFIFDQIPTGLYFFGFVAVAYVVVTMPAAAEDGVTRRFRKSSRAGFGALIVSCVGACLAISYSTYEAKASADQPGICSGEGRRH